MVSRSGRGTGHVPLLGWRVVVGDRVTDPIAWTTLTHRSPTTTACRRVGGFDVVHNADLRPVGEHDSAERQSPRRPAR